MIIKKYIVSNMNEGMTRIRYELGKDAIIISQRKIRKSGILGVFSPKVIEITAAVENSQNENAKTIKKKNNYEKKLDKKDDDFQNSLESIKRLMEREISQEKNTYPDKLSEITINDKILEHNSNVEKEESKINEDIKLNENTNIETSVKENNFANKISINESKNNEKEIESIHKEVTELKSLLNKVIMNTTNGEQNKISLFKDKLKKLDIDEDLQNKLIESLEEKLNGNEDEGELLREALEKDILISNKSLNGKVVLVGPTGVGKTTTIAKLAGRLALVEKKKVGLITVDTYRIGAIEQLKTYAEIMNIPFKVVITMKEMEDAINEMSGCDIVLIDTTGRSSKNAMQLSELRAFVQKANPDHINMVISSTTKNCDIRSILSGYSELEYDNVIITKLDETTAYGSLYNIAKLSNKPISFITIGQNVPDDIMVPTKEKIVSFILGEENIC